MLFAVVATPALAQQLPGDPDAGRAFAQRLCADCHVIGDRSTGRAPEGAPSFPSIATGSTTTELGLRTFLEKPHRGMPNLALTRREIDDAIAFILSLRGH
jgi:mono/diheme cytochrome c family protein